MDKVKKMMVKGIQKEKDDFIKYMEKKQGKVDSSTNISELYYLVANIYSNRLGNDGLGVKVL